MFTWTTVSEGLQVCMVVTVGIIKGPPGKEREFQSLFPMKIREGEGTSRWEWRRLTLGSILPTYIDHLLCARPILRTREKR